MAQPVDLWNRLVTAALSDEELASAQALHEGRYPGTYRVIVENLVAPAIAPILDEFREQENAQQFFLNELKENPELKERVALAVYYNLDPFCFPLLNELVESAVKHSLTA